MSIGREDYQERREARIERYEQRAASAAQASSDAASRSIGITSAIPLGQPILVDHSSAKDHRRTLERADSLMRKSVDASEKASYYAGRASSAARSTAISSDDPEVMDKLKAKLASLQAEQEYDKALNAYYRKNKTVKGFEGISDEEAEETNAELSKMREAIRRPVPSYHLSNRNAGINRLRKRIAALQEVDEMEHIEIDFDGGRIVTNEEINRVQILFDEKPGEDLRSKLKGYGFRWSPREKAWQAQRNPRYLRRAKHILGITDAGTNSDAGEC